MDAHTCPVCHQPLDACPYGGDCGEVQDIYRAEQREKLRDIDPDEIQCDVCGRSYGEASHDECRPDISDDDLIDPPACPVCDHPFFYKQCRGCGHEATGQ